MRGVETTDKTKVYFLSCPIMVNFGNCYEWKVPLWRTICLISLQPKKKNTCIWKSEWALRPYLWRYFMKVWRQILLKSEINDLKHIKLPIGYSWEAKATEIWNQTENWLTIMYARKIIYCIFFQKDIAFTHLFDHFEICSHSNIT